MFKGCNATCFAYGQTGMCQCVFVCGCVWVCVYRYPACAIAHLPYRTPLPPHVALFVFLYSRRTHTHTRTAPGSGKTHTMMGSMDGSSPKDPGLYVSAARDIFRTIEERQHRNLAVHISFYEIYGCVLPRASLWCNDWKTCLVHYYWCMIYPEPYRPPVTCSRAILKLIKAGNCMGTEC